MADDLTARLKARARELGFDAVAVCAAEPSPRATAAYRAWVAAGMAGEMAYMARPDRVAKACAPTVTLTSMRSLVVVGQSHHVGDLPTAVRDDPSRGLIASYARGPDYHDVLLPRLRRLGEWLAAETGGAGQSRAWVDTGPILERDAAWRAGLGFVGRNTMLIRPRAGSWLFLGVLLTAADLAPDAPDPGGTCGSCTRCLTACPTNAFPAPHVLDARRCVSYLTIELRGPIPRDLRPGLGNRVFGCDICNAVCPYNRRFARVAGDPNLTPCPDRMAPPLLGLVDLDEAGFRARFGGTPVTRPGRAGFVRNVCVALGNWAAPETVPALSRAVADPEALVRGHAAWALGRVATGAARAALEQARHREPETWVVAEIESALAGA